MNFSLPLIMQTLMGHNEDGATMDIATGYMVNASLTNGDRFLAFCYAGMLCGKAFGYNFATQTAITVNAVFPKVINTSAIGKEFISPHTHTKIAARCM